MKNWSWWVAVLINLVALGALVSEPAGKSLIWLRPGCAAGLSPACTELGWRMWNGEGVKQDLEGAESLFSRACDHGYGRACGALSWLASDPFQWSPGGSESEKVNRQKAFMVRRKDPARAAAFLERGCEGGDGPACSEIALTLTNRPGYRQAGAAPTVDEARALALLQRACRDLGYSVACSDLIHWYKEKGDQVRLAEAERYRQAADGWPAALKLWLAAGALSILVGILSVRARRRAVGAVRRPRRWMATAGTLAAAFVVLSAVQFSTKDLPMVTVIAWATLLLGLVLAVGTLLVWAARDGTARVVLAVAGFLLLPLGLFAILLSRDIAEARGTTAASVPSSQS
ncbi:MAG: tetratricopeptide repeat protein [Bryobacteraceae bacterium]